MGEPAPHFRETRLRLWCPMSALAIGGTKRSATPGRGTHVKIGQVRDNCSTTCTRCESSVDASPGPDFPGDLSRFGGL
eukprot:1299538-Pyramimonas_sp.AAC.1